MYGTIFKSALGIVLITMLLISCSDDDNEIPLACQLEPDPGDCLAAIPRYYFDKEEQKCKEFIWGGCNGVVPFETMEACRECESN
jgi:hypothetical protein